MEWKQIVKTNSRQLFFVFLAFFLRVLVSCVLVGSVVQKYLVQSVGESLRTSEANIRAGLSESESTMNNAVHSVTDMLDAGASQDEVLAYLSNTTRWMQRKDIWLFGFYGIYGYIRGEFIDSSGHPLAAEYLPQRRPWYDAAVRNTDNAGASAYTEPYVDERTGAMVISVVRNVYGQSGEYYGILIIDMNLSWFGNHVRSSLMSNGTYGVILNQYLVVVGHPKDGVTGLPLRDICKGYREIHDGLMSDHEISSMKITDMDGSDAMVSFKQMSNGWYVGVITPYRAFYKNVYYAAVVLSMLGFILMTILGYILLRLSAEKIHSDEESRSKTTFLTRMSHEIRTPMNAIIGLSELALREYGTPKALEYIAGIKNAGASLLVIINEILDFSKIETGNVLIQSVPYETGSLLNDTLTIIRVRMMEKPLELIVNISPDIPARLIGDEGRIKQILLNLLSNAIKYTNRGFVRFSVSGEPATKDKIRLIFVVEDSGIGIRREDRPKLFGEFIRVDEKRNSGIEGTGLGLAITRSLCMVMGGNITVQSEYGKGSIFTASLLQTVTDWKPMGDMTGLSTAQAKTQCVTFIAPEADVLVVDDFPSNLLVAEGLLTPYRMRVSTCTNGREAVELVRERAFDLVLMDHMMPGMDGVEATGIIRAMSEERCRALPIVALTANAVSGMREMFLENGFNDFLSKPIDPFKLDAVLKKWLPADKCREAPKDEENAPQPAKPQEPPLPEIAGVDTAAGIARIGGSWKRYLDLLEMFRRDVAAGFALLEKMPEESSLRAFTTLVHALKSALANIGANGLSQAAVLLEKAGREADMPVIRDRLPPFREELAALMARLGEVTAAQPRNGEKQSGAEVGTVLAHLQEALEVNDIDAIYAARTSLQALPLTGETLVAVSDIADFILTMEFQKAKEAVTALRKQMGAVIREKT
jgi:signal transduction histidine kinase/CheY-like chemotaxis protein